jgi:predicted TIM-barrel fold metal-dependent hydrolase
MMKMDINDPRTAPVFALAQEMGRPVLIHTGFEEGYGRNTPREEWDRLFRRFPRLTFLLAHMFFPGLESGFSLLSLHENIYLDCTNVFGMFDWPEGPLPFGISRPRMGKEEFLAAIESSRDRILFGSDHPAGMGTMADIVRQVETFGLSEKTVENILFANTDVLLNRLGLV